jgi:hypothetical protein
MARMIGDPRFFAALALLAAALFHGVMFLEFPDVGFERTLELAGLSIWIGMLSGLAVVALSIRNYRSGRDKRRLWPVVVALVSLASIPGAIYIPWDTWR